MKVINRCGAKRLNYPELTCYWDVLADRQLDVSCPGRHVDHQVVQRAPVHLQTLRMLEFKSGLFSSHFHYQSVRCSHLSEQFLYR